MSREEALVTEKCLASSRRLLLGVGIARLIMTAAYNAAEDVTANTAAAAGSTHVLPRDKHRKSQIRPQAEGRRPACYTNPSRLMCECDIAWKQYRKDSAKGALKFEQHWGTLKHSTEYVVLAVPYWF